MLAIRILWLLAAPAAAQLLNLPDLPVVGPLLGGGESTEAAPSATLDPATQPTDPVVTPAEPASSAVEDPAVTNAPSPSPEAPAPQPTVETPATEPIPGPTRGSSPSPSPEPVPSPQPVTPANPTPTPTEPTVAPAQSSPTIVIPPQSPTQQTVQVPTVVVPAPQTPAASPQVPAASPQAPAASPQAPAASPPAPTSLATTPVGTIAAAPAQQSAATPGGIAVPTFAPAAPASASPNGNGNGNGGAGAGVSFFNAPTPAATTVQPVTTLITQGGNTFVSVFVPPSAVAAVANTPSFAPDGTFIMPTSNPDGSASDVNNSAPLSGNGGNSNNGVGGGGATTGGSGMSQGTKIGIGVAGGAAGVAIIAAVIYIFWKRRMRDGRRRLSGGTEAGTLPGDVAERQKMDWETEHSNVPFDFGFEYREKEKKPTDGMVELEGDALPTHATPHTPQTGNPLAGVLNYRR